MGVSLVRYADDFVVLARSKHLLNQYVTPAINNFLFDRGLWLSPHKTKTFALSHKNTQLDFLGYTLKFNHKRSAKRTMVFSRENSNKVLALFPNKEKVRNFILKLKQIISESQNLTAMELISKLNPMIREWAIYYNLDNSSHYRSVVSNALYNMTWNWMRKKHPTLGKKKLALMYFLSKKASQMEVVDNNSPLPDPLMPIRPVEPGCLSTSIAGLSTEIATANAFLCKGFLHKSIGCKGTATVATTAGATGTVGAKGNAVATGKGCQEHRVQGYGHCRVNGQREQESTKDYKYIKIKNTKWTFHGISRTESRYSKTTGKTRIAYLLKPNDSSPIIKATKYELPLSLIKVHAFHPKINELIKFKLSLSLLSSPKTPTLK